MGKTFIRQDLQVASTLTSIVGFVDNVAPAATMESGAAHIADDLNNLRSKVNYLLKTDLTKNWYDVIAAPSALEAGAVRGIEDIGIGLHAIEKKRVVRNVHSLVDVTVGGADNFAILTAPQLPSNTAMAVGAVTTLGTVAAAHTGTFGAHALDEVAGPSAIAPLNFMVIVDGATRDPILSGARQVYGLLQSETATDGHTATGATTTRLQISFVRVNAAGDDLEAVPAGDIQGQTINFCSRERVRFEDLNEGDFLSGAIVDLPSGSTVDRQSAYTGQGTTPVDLVTNAILDLEGAGLSWSIRDDLEAALFSVVEGSAGGTSEIDFGADVDVFDNNALVNDFAAGATIGSAGTNPLEVGVTTGLIQTTAGDLQLGGANGETILNDINMDGEATWAGPGVKVSETTAEVVAYETAFGGEVSIMNALVQAINGSSRTRVDATVTATITSLNDINGPGTPHANVDADLLGYDVAGIGSLEVFINGELATFGAADDYIAGGTPADGDIQWTSTLKAGGNPDKITVIRNGAN